MNGVAPEDRGRDGSEARVTVARVLWFTALAFTLTLSLYPHYAVDATFSPKVQRFDWLFHGVCYFVLCSTAAVGFLRRGGAGFFRRLKIFAAHSLLGLALELCQAMPAINRSASVSDALHNAAGAALGAFSVPSLLLAP